MKMCDHKHAYVESTYYREAVISVSGDNSEAGYMEHWFCPDCEKSWDTPADDLDADDLDFGY